LRCPRGRDVVNHGIRVRGRDDVSGIFGVQLLCTVRRARSTNSTQHWRRQRVSGCPRDQRVTRVLRLLDSPTPNRPNRPGRRGGRIGGQHPWDRCADQGCRAVGPSPVAKTKPLAGGRVGFDGRDRLQGCRTLRKELKTTHRRCRRLFRQCRRRNAGGRTQPARARSPHRVVGRCFSQYNDTSGGPANYMQLWWRGIHDGIRHPTRPSVPPEELRKLAQCSKQRGKLRSHEQIERGDVGDFPNLLKLFRGENTGKRSSRGIPRQDRGG